MVDILDYSSDVKINDGPAAGGGFEEGEVSGVVVEEVLTEDAGAEGVFEDGEVGFLVGVTVGVVFADLMAGKV